MLSTSEGPSGEKSNTQAHVAATEPTEMDVTKLGPFWSLLKEVGYTIYGSAMATSV